MKHLIILLLLVNFFAVAQRGDKIQKLKALKTSFITTELDLSSSEAEKFWPIYNQYEKENFELKTKKLGKLLRELNQPNIELSEDLAQKKLKEIHDLEDQIRALDKKLFEDLKPIISYQKILKLKIAETRFQRNLIMQRARP